MSDAVLARLKPSPLRRVLAVAMLAALGGLLIWIALATPPASLSLRLLLLALGAGALYLGSRVWQATGLAVELTEDGLSDSAGRVLCRMEDVVAVERGAFAFKPSNGFLVRLARPAGGRVWAPGLWWRLGRRIGVGGVTPAAQGKVMAELISERLARRGPAGR